MKKVIEWWECTPDFLCIECEEEAIRAWGTDPQYPPWRDAVFEQECGGV